MGGQGEAWKRPDGALPLRYRVPNPPPVFAGREFETNWIRARLATEAFCVVCGPGGIGKTSLVLHAVQGVISADAPRAIYIDLRPSNPPDDVRLEIARALMAAQGMVVDWANLAAERDALNAVVVDIAENDGWWVIVDDLQNADPESIRGLLEHLHRYARRSRWILSTRVEPPAVVGGRLLSLGAMPTQDLVQLARICGADGDDREIEGAAAAAEGSPWRLLRVLADPGGDDGLDGPFKNLEPAIAAAVARMSVFEVPMRGGILSAFVPDLSSDGLDRLVQLGLVDRVGETYRLHDVARENVGEIDAEQLGAWRQQAGRLLLAEDDPVARLEALRLAVACEDQAAQDELLARHGESLLSNGYAHRLWRLLGQGDSVTVRLWRLRCAVELGDPSVLSQVDEPLDHSANARILWARALFALGRLEGAVEAAAMALSAATAAGDEDVAYEAGYFRARALANLSRWDESVPAFDALEPRNAHERVTRDVVVARCLVFQGDGERALARVRGVRRDLDALASQTRRELSYEMASILYELGATDDAIELLRREDGEDSRRESSTLLYTQTGRRALYQRASLALCRGTLNECRSILGSLWPFMGSASLLRPHLMRSHAIAQLAAGEFAGLHAAFNEVKDEGKRRTSRGLYCIGAFNLRKLLLLTRSGPEPVEEPAMVLPASTLIGGMLAVMRLMGRVRAGEILPDDAFEAFRARGDLPELRAAALIGSGEAALVRGDGARALLHAEAAVDEARQGGLGIVMAEALVLRCDALLALNRSSLLEDAAAELAEHADQMPSRRFAADARFYEEVGLEPEAELVEVASLAASDHSPASSRRAAALLGRRGNLDAVDRAVVDAIARHGAWQGIRCVAIRDDDDVDWHIAWGVDGVTQEVWLPGGRRIGLGQKALLWRLLMAMAEHGGAASKEEMVLRAWEVAEYHPLRHDNRLQVAMRKLRRTVEDDPSCPTRVLTTPDGYELGGPLLVRLRV